MGDKSIPVGRLIEKRKRLGLIVLPLSLAFRQGEGMDGTPMAGKPRMSSLRADYPPEWPSVKWQMRSGAIRGDEARCSCCGEWVPAGLIQIAHLGWNPADLRLGWLMPLCPDCHREWDTPQQDSAAALTAAGEDTLPWHRYKCRLTTIRDQVQRHGLIRLAPAAMDLAVAASLQDGPCDRSGLVTRLGTWFPMIVRAISSAPELEDCIEHALIRLGMRLTDDTKEPFVVEDRHGELTLTLGRLHLDKEITYTPTSCWTNPRYLR